MLNYQRVPYLYLYNFRETSMTGAKDMWEIVEPWAGRKTRSGGRLLPLL